MQSILPKVIFLFLLTMPLLTNAEEANTNDSILSEANITKTSTPKGKAPDKVKNFSFTDLTGKKHELSEYKGKWLIVNYWATYCPPCRVEVTDLDMFARDHKNNAVVLGMDAGGNPIEELKQFKKEYELSYTMAPAQDSTLISFGIIDALPTTFIVSPKGEIIDKHIGMITYDDLAYYTSPKEQKNAQVRK